MSDVVGVLPIDTIICGHWNSVLKTLPAECVDVIITDPPYGITSNSWDKPIDLEIWWTEAWRVCRGAIIMTAGQPFTSKVVCSQIKHFKHEWIWQKNRGSNFANTVREPMKEHESVLVFARKKWTYNPQRQERSGGGLDRALYSCTFDSQSGNYRKFSRREGNTLTKDRVPSSIQRFNTQTGLHPTQKPESLIGYLIKTYTNEGDVVLDPFIGSGTTAKAARDLGRHYIGIDIDDGHCKTARKRLEQQTLFRP